VLQEKMDTTVSVCGTDSLSLSDTHTHTLRLIKWECRFIVGSQGVTDADVGLIACSACPNMHLIQNHLDQLSTTTLVMNHEVLVEYQKHF